MNVDLSLQKSLCSPAWSEALRDEFRKPYFKELESFLSRASSDGRKIYPPPNLIFEALNLTPLSQVKAVILGQDPYHGPDQAHGLSFSVRKGIPLPPSLKNILKELKEGLNISSPDSGDLTPWARQGVLLLNCVMTVEKSKPGFHEKRGWEIFTDKIISVLGSQQRPIGFVLWGSYAHKKAVLIDESRHLVIKSPHPSPLSSYRGFFGSRPFEKVNEFLIKNDQKPIDWSL